MRKEEDLKDAEDQISKLQEDLRKLEDILERTSTRSVPLRNKDDSPEMHFSKKTKVEEIPANTMAIRKQNNAVKREKADTSIAIRKHEPKLRLDSQGNITSTEPEDPVRAAWVDSTRQEVERRRKARVIQEMASKDYTIQITIAGKKVLGIGQACTRKVSRKNW